MKYRIYLINPFEANGINKYHIDCKQYVNSTFGIHYSFEDDAKLEFKEGIATFDDYGFVPLVNISNIQPL